MRVVNVVRFGGPEVLLPSSAPRPKPGPGELVIDVAVSDVMFLDTMIRAGRGVDIFPIRPPYIPGNGVGGDVAGIGEGLDEGWLGRRVIAHTGGPGGSGGYAEQAIAGLDDVVAVPGGLDLFAATAVIHDGPTALRVAKLVDAKPGEWVLVLGAAGGMGILLVQLLSARGAFVIGAARGQVKLDAVAKAGAASVIDYAGPDWTLQVLEATGGHRPEVVLDGVGGQLGQDAYRIIARGGRFSAHGAPSGSFAQVDPADARSRNVTVTGLGDLQIRPGDRANLARELLPQLLSGQISPLIGQTFPLEQAAGAHRAIESRSAVGKTLLEV